MSNDAPPVYRLASDQDRPATPPPAPTRPKGRRWVWGVLALVVVVAVPVVLVVGWFVRGTVKAGRGAEAPSVALLSWMYSFRDPDAVDADRYVIPERRAELSRQRAEFVAAARASGLVVTIEIGTPPAGQPAAENVDGDQAAVTDWYQAQWPLGRGALNHHTESLPWRADVRRSGDGWRIWSVQFPPWCGPGGYVARCGTAPAASPSSSPTPSPTETDLLQNPRDMLRCGPRDPFRSLHSCPSETTPPG